MRDSVPACFSTGAGFKLVASGPQRRLRLEHTVRLQSGMEPAGIRLRRRGWKAYPSALSRIARRVRACIKRNLAWESL